MFERVRDTCEEFVAVMSISSRLLLAMSVTILSPGVIMLMSLVIPHDDAIGGLGRILAPVFDNLRDVAPWGAFVVFLYFSFTTADVFQRERDRLLRL